MVCLIGYFVVILGFVDGILSWQPTPREPEPARIQNSDVHAKSSNAGKLSTVSVEPIADCDKEAELFDGTGHFKKRMDIITAC